MGKNYNQVGENMKNRVRKNRYWGNVIKSPLIFLNIRNEHLGSRYEFRVGRIPGRYNQGETGLKSR
jgi:hypothetical protein